MDFFRSILIWFAGIMLMIIFFPLTVIIWVLSLPFDRNRVMTHRMLVYQSFVISHILPIWKIKIEGRKKAVAGTTYVIIANHQSILDILLINSLLYRFKWVSKIENEKVPILGWYLKMADYLTVDRDDKESKEVMLERAFECLRKKNSVMLFPEGTRSTDSTIGFFKRGAFQLALSARKPILPVIIDGSGGILPKHGFVFGEFRRITVRVLDPVEPGDFPTRDHDELASYFQRMMADELNNIRKRNTGE